MSEDGVRAIEKRRVPGEGLHLMLKQLMAFPKPIRAWNPMTGVMEEKAKMEVFFDASIPELQYANYEGFAVGRGSKERILILLASLGYSYPTTAISEATDVARSTTSRLLWELRRDGLIEGGASRGAFVDSELWPYRYGPLRENYYMLTEEGAEAVGRLMKVRVVPLAPPAEMVEKEMKEHPWLTPEEAARISLEHLEEARRRVKEIREKQARGEELTRKEVVILYGREVSKEEGEEIGRREQRLGVAAEAPVGVITPAERRLLEEIRKAGGPVEETPWGRAARIAEETREKMRREG